MKEKRSRASETFNTTITHKYFAVKYTPLQELLRNSITFILWTDSISQMRISNVSSASSYKVNLTD